MPDPLARRTRALVPHRRPRPLAADGVLEYLGRIDYQVKLRGYRIELGEIEADLTRRRASRSASSSRARTSRATCASWPTSARAEAMHRLATRPPPARAPARLHDPAALHALDAIPLLPNGKLDRRALPKPDTVARQARRTRRAAHAARAQVLGAMEHVLNLPGLGIDDNFFALGGHSLLAAKLDVAAQQGFRRQPAVAHRVRISDRGASGRGNRDLQPVSAPRSEPIRHRARAGQRAAHVMQERIRFVEEMFPGRVTYNTPSAHRLGGPMDVAKFKAALNEVVARQPRCAPRSHRTRDGRAAGVIADKVAYELPFEDLWAAAAEREARS